MSLKSAGPLADLSPDDWQPFCYFDRADTSLISGFLADWRRSFPQFRVHGDDEVTALLDQRIPGSGALYRALRLPAAKADIARLALLHARGGLYVDCHCGLLEAARLRDLIAMLDTHEIIVVERTGNPNPDPAFPRHLINGVIFGRAGAPIFLDLLGQTIENLQRFATRVAEGAPQADYDIWSMLGAYVLTTMVLEPASDFADFRRSLRGSKARIIPLPDLPIKLGAHRRDYNGPNREQHWSKRQGADPLLDPSGLAEILAGLPPFGTA